MTHETFDPITQILFYHWQLRRLLGSPQDFEQLFQDVAARAQGQFVRIRPYGRVGDRKIDGLCWGDGTAYQVYSPDEMKEADTRHKIEEDLAGAVAHWKGELKRWVFVYNVRRGVPADVMGCLQAQRQKYPDITIESLSNDDLWKIVRSLPLQDRVELLGPPPGYEDLFPLTAALPNEIQERLDAGRFVVVQDIMSPINLRDVVSALAPAKAFGPPLFVRPPSPAESWQGAADYQRQLIDDALARSRDRLPRFAVFSLSPIPLAIHLGYVLSDRVEVEPFQYHRDRTTWCWPESIGDADLSLETSGIPKTLVRKPTEVSIRVSLSADVRLEDVRAVLGELPVEIELRVGQPDVGWLVSREQLQALSRSFRALLADIRRLVPDAQRLHLFYAGPTGGAIVIGQAINPRMNPPVALYEYSRQQQPRYRHVLTLD